MCDKTSELLRLEKEGQALSLDIKQCLEEDKALLAKLKKSNKGAWTVLRTSRRRLPPLELFSMIEETNTSSNRDHIRQQEENIRCLLEKIKGRMPDTKQDQSINRSESADSI
jgi:hypothetical protein